MPYINGKRVTLDEWQAANGSSLEQFKTGPRGENPGEAPELDAETQAPKSEGKKAGSRRSNKGAAKVAAAIATATGQELPDLTGLDASTEDNDSDSE